ncbi:TetR/AcrR family transcriptional regulator C-terminal domain-containing protein [Arthrobacter gandavensis]|uniref:TetR/AcrR family transcriptional regulator C-terminal domain-containing protein n=1 Tax=Arthrobacter gandavensis TaxID=169960 RepID=UPI00188E9465|nr:TetR/AcrR family transcriptional regulator C-terminal domain-containing protein [Arthrobacter gandavensis]MBF4994379.1 TetR/AcrR family transcriptional regulator C-terminal domain-containing protein [Arthrobacter gandavensis]
MAPPQRTPHEKGSAKPRLTRKLVLRTALRMVDSGGLDALSMRRLGQELQCDPMALYRYAASRAELLDGVAELILDELAIDPDAPDWQEQLRRTAHDVRRLALLHPHAVPLLVTRPLSTPLGMRPLGMLRPLELIVALLVHAGFTPADALHAYRTYYGFLYGHILNELQETVVNPEEEDPLLRLALYRLPPRDFPRLRELAPVLAEYDGAAELDEALDILLSGLAQKLQKDPAGHGRYPL